MTQTDLFGPRAFAAASRGAGPAASATFIYTYYLTHRAGTD
jgi:hypothetical protein